MIIDRNGQWAFIHIPKNGGTSIRASLLAVGGVQLGDVWHPRYKVHEERLKGIPYIFAITRNPYARLISNWLHVVLSIRHSLNKPAARLSEIRDTHFLAVFEGISGCLDQPGRTIAAQGQWHQFAPQYTWIEGCENVITYKLENGMEAISKNVSGKIGKTLEIPHANKAKQDLLPWQEYFEDRRMREKVYQFYHDDFCLFGYDR